MCIVKSVGQSGRNDLTDVMVFQILFNLNIGRFRIPSPPNSVPMGRSGPAPSTPLRASRPPL